MSDFDKIVQNFFKNYQDRKMTKWTGFFLSDHTLAINKDEQRRKARHPPKKAMAQEEISLLLLKAYSNHRLVHVQLKIVDKEDQLAADIVGFVNGYNEEDIVVDGQKVALEDINHIEVD